MGRGLLRSYRGGRELGNNSRRENVSIREISTECLEVSDLIDSIRSAIEKVDRSFLLESLNALSRVFRIQSNEIQESHNRRIMTILEGLKQKDQAQWRKPLSVLDFSRNEDGLILEHQDKPLLISPSVDLIMREPFSHGGIKNGEQSRNNREALLLRIYGIEIWRIARILRTRE